LFLREDEKLSWFLGKYGDKNSTRGFEEEK
jgi:hypothetical protein